MELYGRQWRVQVGTLQTTDVDVTFKVKRTLRPTPGTCELSLYNLTETHRNEAKAARRPLVQIEAGYVDGMSVIFRGNARTVAPAPEGPDWITKVTAGDGEHAIRSARASRSFGADTTLEEVVRYVAEAMGVGVGNAPEALRGATLDRVGGTFPHGTVVHGAAARELSELLDSAGLSWSVQDGVLQVVPRGGALNRAAILLGSDTGLLDAPEVGKNRVVKAKALIQPDLVPGRLVRLASRVVSGTYRITVAEYSGDTRGDDWTADLELRQVT